MSVCRNCGNELQQHQGFCTHCGAENNRVAPSRAAGSINKLALSAPAKRTIILVIILAIGLFSAHMYLSNYYKPEKAVERFEQAVKQKNYGEMRNILENGGTDANLSDSQLKGYAAFLTKDHDFDQIISQLQQDAAEIKHYGQITAVTDDAGNKLVMLVEGPKKFMLYPQYFVEAIPFTVKATSNLENTDVTINGSHKLIKEKNEEVTLGKVLPGPLKLTAVYNGKYTKLTGGKTVDFKGANGNTVTADLELNGKYVTIYSNGDNADIYANGQNTGLKTGEDQELGPVPTDGSLELYAVLNHGNGTIKSNVVRVNSEGEVDLSFKEIADEQKQAENQDRIMKVLAMYGSSDDQKGAMSNFMNEFLSASIQAYNSRDFSPIASYFVPDGPAYKDTSSYIPTLGPKGITESLLGVQILDMQTTNNGFIVKTREDYDIYYQDGSGKHKTFETTYNLVANTLGLQEYSENIKTIGSEDISGYYN